MGFLPAETFLLFLAGALLLNITPGPDMAFTLASAVKGGVRAGIASAVGIGAGSLAWAVATGAGLAALLAGSQNFLTVLRVAGGLYLIYLAIETYRHRRAAIDASGAGDPAAAFRAGFLTNLLNPKVGLFYIAFLPAFTSAEAGPVWSQVLMLGAAFSISGALILMGVALAAGGIRNRLASSPPLRARLRTVSALAFGALGLHLVFARNP